MTDILWTSSDAAVATGGRTSGSWLASGISIDTRALQPGDLFVALTDQRDGHDFVGAAFEAGAVAALVSRDVAAAGPCLLVEDTLTALEALGVAARARCGAKRTAVTGSVGKTSVKEMLARVFRAAGPAHWSERSFNNQWGVPLTLARMPQHTRNAVFEIGMSTPGEIAPRSHMVRPHGAIVTTVAGVHLEGLGSVDAVAEEKGDIFAGLEAGGVALLPLDNPHFETLKRKAEEALSDVRLLTFGTSAEADAHVLDYREDGQGCEIELSVMGERAHVRFAALGRHWGVNAAATLLAAVAVHDLSLLNAAEALSGFTPPPGRGVAETLPLPTGGDVTLVDDSYNANPTSMRAALSALSTRSGGRKLAVLGQMGELGDGAEAMHAELAGPVAEAGVEAVWLVGELMGALGEALPGTIQKHLGVKADDLLTDVKNALRPGDILLIKGSNSCRLGPFADDLRQWSASGAQRMMDASRTEAGF